MIPGLIGFLGCCDCWWPSMFLTKTKVSACFSSRIPRRSHLTPSEINSSSHETTFAIIRKLISERHNNPPAAWIQTNNGGLWKQQRRASLTASHPGELSAIPIRIKRGAWHLLTDCVFTDKKTGASVRGSICLWELVQYRRVCVCVLLAFFFSRRSNDI